MQYVCLNLGDFQILNNHRSRIRSPPSRVMFIAAASCSCRARSKSKFQTMFRHSQRSQRIKGCNCLFKEIAVKSENTYGQNQDFSTGFLPRWLFSVQVFTQNRESNSKKFQ